MSNFRITGIPEEKEYGAEKMFEEIMADNSPNFAKIHKPIDSKN